MVRSVRLAALVLLLAPATRAGAEGDGFFFKDGDRVVMIGDSITEQHLYSNYVEIWTVTRFPGWNLTFRNVGIGGDRSTGGDGRFRRDVLPYRPTALTVDFGMNDGGYRAFDEPTYNTYLGGLRGIAEKAKSADIRVAWITPQPLDNAEPGPTALTGYNLTLERFSDGVRSVAEKNGGVFVDQFHPYLGVLDKARSSAERYARITGGDAVHPGPPGQALMAAAILKGLHFPPLVSSVAIDLAAEDRAEAVNCTVADLHREGDAVRFRRADRALPFFPEEAKSILAWAPIRDDLNAYTLKVAGLKPGTYAIRLDGTKVAERSAEDLAAGVNLAEAALGAGPVADQVQAVKEAVEAKNRYHHDRIFRGVVLSEAKVPEWLGLKLSAADIDARRRAAIAERSEELARLDAAVRKALEPRPHEVEIVPLAPADSASDKRPSGVPEGYTLLYAQDFARPDSVQDLVMTDPGAWSVDRGDGSGGGGKPALELTRQSKYSPPFRSPVNIALIGPEAFGDSVVEADCLQTGKEYGHRDMVFVFGYQSPARFYYVHIATQADDHANNIFLVNDAARVKIARTTNAGNDWGLGVWHKVRIVRTVADGSVKVYFDDMSRPIMEAEDKIFGAGWVGFGSFDDTGKVTNIKVWGPRAEARQAPPFVK